MNVISFNRSAQLPTLMAASDDLAESIHKREAETAAALRITFLLGLTGSDVWLPFVRFSPHAKRNVQAVQPMCDAVSETLDAVPVYEMLATVLAESVCPHVKALRVAMADEYARAHARHLAKLGLPQ
jgi:hypothetical protein